MAQERHATGWHDPATRCQPRALPHQTGRRKIRFVAAFPPARTLPVALPLAAVVVVGVALRTLVWWPSHNLFGVLEYDDGVYYAAARLLLDVYLAVSDRWIVRPPGVPLVLLPAAVFGYLLGAGRDSSDPHRRSVTEH